jgi:tetratricopeptide (TPR) repeat protein
MADSFEFIFWEALKALGLVVASLLAVKAARPFAARDRRGWLLYGAILALTVLGAQAVGKDVAAEVYGAAVARNLDHHDYALAYSNALRAVELRPGSLLYWQLLVRAKFAMRQFDSLLGDEPVLQSLSPKGLSEEDVLRFTYARYFLGRYDQVISIAGQIERQNPNYPKSYVLAGLAELGLRRYSDAERDFLEALRILPTQEDAVEGLAQVYFLEGDARRAVAVLDATAHYPFPAEQRLRFEKLKALYEQ